MPEDFLKMYVYAVLITAEFNPLFQYFDRKTAI